MIEVTKSDFAEKTQSGKVVLDFWAPWCGQCKAMAPMMETVEKDAGIPFYKINVSTETELADQFGVISLPTLIFMENGVEYNRLTGMKPKGAILNAIK